LARDYGARLHLVHAIPLSLHVSPYGLPPSLPEAAACDARMGLNKLAAECDGLRVETHLLDEEAPSGILRSAREAYADLIVMGTHGASGLTRLLAGSIAESVQRQATCPVLTVRLPDGAKTEVTARTASDPEMANASS
jgi:nucleotide-binding universal stress UspA family protein